MYFNPNKLYDYVRDHNSNADPDDFENLGYSPDLGGTFYYDKNKKEHDNMSEKSYGAQASFAFSKNPGEPFQVGITAKTSDGSVNLDRHMSGDDLDSIIQTLFDGVAKEISAANDKKSARKEVLAKQKAERDRKRGEIADQISDLQKQLDALNAVDDRAEDDFRALEDDKPLIDDDAIRDYVQSIKDIFNKIEW